MEKVSKIISMKYYQNLIIHIRSTAMYLYISNLCPKETRPNKIYLSLIRLEKQVNEIQIVFLKEKLYITN
jgi:hypothetical protein